MSKSLFRPHHVFCKRKRPGICLNDYLVLDLDIRDGVIWLDVQGDGLSRKSLDEDLHSTTTKSKNKMEGRFLLDVVVREGSALQINEICLVGFKVYRLRAVFRRRSIAVALEGFLPQKNVFFGSLSVPRISKGLCEFEEKNTKIEALPCLESWPSHW